MITVTRVGEGISVKDAEGKELEGYFVRLLGRCVTKERSFRNLAREKGNVDFGLLISQNDVGFCRPWAD